MSLVPLSFFLNGVFALILARTFKPVIRDRELVYHMEVVSFDIHQMHVLKLVLCAR